MTLLDGYVGVGDAWALVHAADAAWNGAAGDWVSLTDGPTGGTPTPDLSD